MPKANKEVERIGLGNIAVAHGLSSAKVPKATLAKSIGTGNVDNAPGLSPSKDGLKVEKSFYKSKGLGDVEEVPGLSFGKEKGRKLDEVELERAVAPGYKL